MKYFKSFLLASVFSSVLVSASYSTITSDELADHIRSTRSCPVASTVHQESPTEKGWFSFVRKNTGNFLRGLGDELRTKRNPQTAAGYVSQLAKDGLVRGLSYMTGIPLNKKILNPLGNGLRTVGQWIKGGEATQTTTRVILNNLELNKSSKDIDVENALRTVAAASLKADATTAVKTYEDVVLGLKKRGFSTKSLNTEQIYLNALAGQTLRNNSNLSCEDFSKEMRTHGMSVLNKMNGIKGFDIEKYLGEVFYTESAHIRFDAVHNFVVPAI